MNIKTAPDDRISIIHSDQISGAASTAIRGFIQSRKITLQDVHFFNIFRYGGTANKDIAAGLFVVPLQLREQRPCQIFD